MQQDGFITVIDDDGARERLDLDDKIWRTECTTDCFCANNAQFDSSDLNLKDIKPMKFQTIADYFVTETFLKHQAQEFEQFFLRKVYDAEEAAFLKTVKIVDDVPKRANVSNSHTLYKMTSNDDGSFKLKGRIEPHDNEVTLRGSLLSDCATCTPVELWLVEYIAALKGWTLHKANVKSLFF